MADDGLLRFAIGMDNEITLWDGEDDAAVLVGAGGRAHTGKQGVSYAGAGGEAVAQTFGVAIAGPRGTARGGAGSLAFAYDGGQASSGDESVAWSKRGGTAVVEKFGVAMVQDSTSKGGNGSVAFAIRWSKTSVTTAQVGQFGVAVVHSHPDFDPASPPATAIADNGSLAVAFDGNWVQGAKGALLVAAYTASDGEYKFAVGVVDGVSLKANQPNMVGENGEFVAARGATE